MGEQRDAAADREAFVTEDYSDTADKLEWACNAGLWWLEEAQRLKQQLGYAKLEGNMELAVLYRRVDAPEDTIPWSRAAWQWRDWVTASQQRFTREE